MNTSTEMGGHCLKARYDLGRDIRKMAEREKKEVINGMSFRPVQKRETSVFRGILNWN